MRDFKGNNVVKGGVVMGARRYMHCFYSNDRELESMSPSHKAKAILMAMTAYEAGELSKQAEINELKNRINELQVRLNKYEASGFKINVHDEIKGV